MIRADPPLKDNGMTTGRGMKGRPPQLAHEAQRELEEPKDGDAGIMQELWKSQRLVHCWRLRKTHLRYPASPLHYTRLSLHRASACLVGRGGDDVAGASELEVAVRHPPPRSDNLVRDCMQPSLGYRLIGEGKKVLR